MAKTVFRKVALERLASPEQIDRLLVVVSIRGWIALAVILLLTVCIVIWSFVGEITVTASGAGVFFNPDNIHIIRSSVQGAVEQVNFTEGDQVKEGEELLTLANPSILSKYRELKEGIEKREKSLTLEKEKNDELLGIRLRLSRSILELQRMKLHALEEAMPQMTQEIYDAKINLQTREGEVALLEEEVKNLNYPAPIEAQERELLSLQENLKNVEESKKNLKIRSPINGTVLLIHSVLGEEVQPGSILLWVETAPSEGEENYIYGFFPVDQGELIKEGMKVHLQFASVDPEKYGKMIGTVRKIFPYAATEEGSILRSIPSKQLRDFLALQSTALVIQIKPDHRKDDPLAYQWTTKNGPPFEIHPGTIASVKAIIERKKPISYILPIISNEK